MYGQCIKEIPVEAARVPHTLEIKTKSYRLPHRSKKAIQWFILHIKFGMGSAVSWSMVQEIIPQWLYWKLELMQVIVMGFNPQLTHLFEELQPLRKQGWHLWGLNTQSGDAKWCEMSEWTGTPRSFISFSYETSMSRRHCFVRAHAVWLSSHSMTLGAGGLQPPSPICVHGNTSPWY